MFDEAIVEITDAPKNAVVESSLMEKLFEAPKPVQAHQVEKPVEAPKAEKPKEAPKVEKPTQALMVVVKEEPSKIDQSEN